MPFNHINKINMLRIELISVPMLLIFKSKLPVTATGVVNKAIIKWDQSMKTGQSVGQFDQLLLLVLSIKLKL